MDIRISTIRSGSIRILKVDGALTAEKLPEMERAAATMQMPFTVDLSDLRAVDESGIQALRELMDSGAELVGLSPFIALSLGLGEDDAETR